MSRRTKINLVSKEKKPITLDKHIGIEVEFISPFSHDHIAGMIVDVGLEHIVNLGVDCSIEPDDFDFHGYEVRLCSKEKNLQSNLNKLQCVLNKCNAIVNNSCGLHVHLDIRQRKPMIALTNLLSKHGEIRSMVPDHRRENYEFCEEADAESTYNELVAMIYGSHVNEDKFRDISVATYNKLGTFEIRIHQGTVDMQAVYNWCAYLIHIVDDKPVMGWLKKYVNTTKKSWA